MKFRTDRIQSFYQPSVDGNRVLAIFENPTWKEQMLNRPVMGETGIHLSLLFENLRNMECRLSRDFGNLFSKYRIGIVNAIRFSGDLTCLKQSALDCLIDENHEIVDGAIRNSDIVFLFGEVAQKAYDYCVKGNSRLPNSVIGIYHLSRNALMQICNPNALGKFLERKSHVGFVPQLPYETQIAVISEYIAYKYEDHEKLNLSFKEFQSFIRPFLKTGDGKIPQDFGAIRMSGGRL